jgi:hypothetical protein
MLTISEQQWLQDTSDQLEDNTGVRPQVAIEQYKDGKLVKQIRLDNA